MTVYIIIYTVNSHEHTEINQHENEVYKNEDESQSINMKMRKS